jgi:gluconokinase
VSALHVVVMGVSGCGKSEVGQRIADALGLPLIEGDSFHPPANIAKMKSGVPLTDEDRAGWLDTLARELAARPHGAVLTCSALKRAYRDRLRAATADLRFVHLSLPEAEAQRRVASRPGHFYPPALVASQFAALEDPAGEPGVVTVDACLPFEEEVARALDGLRGEPPKFNNP